MKIKDGMDVKKIEELYTTPCFICNKGQYVIPYHSMLLCANCRDEAWKLIEERSSNV